uniref:Uncharacterized protein n=1 Tax=Hemiselmis andersenii TaxID=464988 RepID=A0A6U4TQ95_HEMAN|mmetsp:Transcript_20309/g.49108  ORF Transcript_20309/g.49108 Transcript_20309/m.49108 type:complete len:251 (+) Transcript_20309:268-1020(+)
MAGHVAIIGREENVPPPNFVPPKLAPYASPPPSHRTRGDATGKGAGWDDIELLRGVLRATREVEAMTVAPHPSVLHQKHKQLSALMRDAHGALSTAVSPQPAKPPRSQRIPPHPCLASVPAPDSSAGGPRPPTPDPPCAAGGCEEAEWGLAMLDACESIEERRRVAGGLSTMQYRGTAHYWSKVHGNVRRRCAEKALCAVRRLSLCPRGSREKVEALEMLAATVSLGAPHRTPGVAPSSLSLPPSPSLCV